MAGPFTPPPGYEQPRPWQIRFRFPNLSPRRVPGTVAIAAVIIIMFLVEVSRGVLHDATPLIGLGAVIPTLFHDHQYWRLIAAMFLHGDGTRAGAALHIGGNLLSLLQIGSLYEEMFGTRRFLFTYFAAGIVASLCSALHFLLLSIDGASVGASGAIFGILGAFIFSIRRSPRYRDDRQAGCLVIQFLFWIVFYVVIGFFIEEIDNAAHIGGLVAGLLLGFVPHRVPPATAPADEVVDVARS